mgnify:CR=1 FL=1
MRKGLKADIKTLDEAEIGLAIDTKEVFVGTSTGNVQLAKQADVKDNQDKIGILQTSVDSNTSHLAESMQQAVNLENFNPDGTGVTDSLSAFTQAVNKANSISKVATLPVPVELPPGTYRIVKTADLAIPSLICRGGFATIIVEDPYAFVVSSNFVLSNVTILSKNTYAKSTATFKPIFKSSVDIQNVSFNNVVFDSQLSAADGTVRASQCVNLKGVKNLKFNNVTVKGYRHGFTVDGLSENIKGTMLHFENVELPIYLRGSSPSITDENYAKNIQFTNVSHVNTQAQRQNFYTLQGSDTFLLEKCDTVDLTNITSENPVERACYLSSSRNVVCTGWNLKNALGIKFVGKSDTAQSVETIASNCHISDVHAIFNDNTLTQQGYIAEFYWAKDWSVKDCTIKGNGIASVIVSTMHYIENGVIEDCFGYDLKRGLFEYSYIGNIDNPDPSPDILAGNYTAGVKGLTIRKNTVKNSNTLDYDVIKLSDALPPSAGTYRYQDVKIIDNTIINPVDDFGVSLGTNYCKGLININSVQDLYIEGNTVIGHKRLDANGNPITLPIQVGSNSKNVVVKHEETARGYDMKYVWGTLYVSADTKIIINTVHRSFSFQDIATITVKHDQTNLRTTKDISTAFRINGRTSISDTTDFSLPIVGLGVAGYTLPNLFGTVDITSDAGDTGGYVVTKAGVITLKSGSSALYVTSTTDTKLAFIKDGSLPRYYLRFKLGAASTSFLVSYSINAS